LYYKRTLSFYNNEESPDARIDAKPYILIDAKWPRTGDQLECISTRLFASKSQDWIVYRTDINLFGNNRCVSGQYLNAEIPDPTSSTSWTSLCFLTSRFLPRHSKLLDFISTLFMYRHINEFISLHQPLVAIFYHSEHFWWSYQLATKLRGHLFNHYDKACGQLGAEPCRNIWISTFWLSVHINYMYVNIPIM